MRPPRELGIASVFVLSFASVRNTRENRSLSRALPTGSDECVAAVDGRRFRSTSGPLPSMRENHSFTSGSLLIDGRKSLIDECAALIDECSALVHECAALVDERKSSSTSAPLLARRLFFPPPWSWLPGGTLGLAGRCSRLRRRTLRVRPTWPRRRRRTIGLRPRMFPVVGRGKKRLRREKNLVGRGRGLRRGTIDLR